MRKVIIAIALFVSSLSFAQSNFSDATLQKFATAYSEIRIENNQMQLNMISEIEKAGLTNDQFTTIHMKLKDPSKSSEVSNDEKKKYNAALENIKVYEKDTQKSFESIIKSKGLTLETYQAIAKACKDDKALNNKVMAFINK